MCVVVMLCVIWICACIAIHVIVYVCLYSTCCTQHQHNYIQHRNCQHNCIHTRVWIDVDVACLFGVFNMCSNNVVYMNVQCAYVMQIISHMLQLCGCCELCDCIDEWVFVYVVHYVINVMLWFVVCAYTVYHSYHNTRLCVLSVDMWCKLLSMY